MGRSEWTARTPSGPVTVRVDGAVGRARGIPYAAAERFAAPGPVAPWEAPHDGESAPLSPQPADGLFSVVDPGYLERQGFDEHCQRLSVTLPADAASRQAAGAGLPVVVWIHGGSYVTGGGDLPAYDPALLVEEQGVIVVSVTYRLGVLGFLGDGTGPAPNLGLLDIVAALEWVQRSIGAFGGDPGRVTAMGQSAGADAIVALMAAPAATGLFARAIIQSAPLGITRGRDPMTSTMLAAAGTVASDAPVADVLDAQMRAARSARKHGLRGLMPFGPHWGQAPLPPETERDARMRESASVDLLVGHMADEGALMGMRLPGLIRVLDAPLVGGILHRLTTGALARRVYERAAESLVRAHRDAGGRAIGYSLRWRAQGSPMRDGHGMDLPLLLGDPQLWADSPLVGQEGPERLLELGRRLRAAWGEFVRTGTVSDATAEAVPELTLRR